MSQRSRRLSGTVLVLLLALTACGSASPQRESQGNTRAASASPPATLADLTAVDDLGSLFNAHNHETQLILLLSPG